MKKAIIVAIALVLSITGGFLALWLNAPAYRGPAAAASEQHKHLAARLRAHVQKLAGEIGKRSLTKSPAGLERAAVYVEEQFAGVGFKPERQTFSVSGYLGDGLFGATHATQSTANIIVEIPGSSKKSEVVVVGAHYDGVLDSPAANDNASGVAVILEISRALAKQKLERTVRFVAFTNEEPPFFRSHDMGSYRYAESCKDRGDHIVAMLSLETLGYYSDRPDSQHFPVAALGMAYPTTGNFVAFIGNVDERATLSKCLTSFTAAEKFPAEMLAAPVEFAGVDFSDQLNFWLFGYPGIMVTDTAPYRYPHYHTAEDTPDKIDYEKLAIVTSGLTNVVSSLANK